MSKRLLILGSTGSIGVQALDVLARSDELELVGLSAERSWEALVEQARTHGVKRIALVDEHAAARAAEAWTDGEVLSGPEGLVQLVVESGAELVLNALVGSAGLGPTVATLGEGIDLALANKESLVVGGELVIALAEATGAQIVPVDSEHTALHQLLAEQPPGAVERLTITASGGPFRGRTRAELEDVTVKQALAHPTWAMGGKITIDSATLMNKGLELMEAHHLFGTPYDRIDVVVHPQSLVHGLIQLADGAMLAHLGPPDMRIAISYALHGGESVGVCRIEPLDLAASGAADVRAGRPRRVSLPAPGARGGARRGDGAVRAERRQRDRRARVPGGSPALHRDSRGDRTHALRAARRAGARVRVALRGRPAGQGGRGGGRCNAHMTYARRLAGKRVPFGGRRRIERYGSTSV